MPQLNKKGFTLIELIIVIAIMAILVGVLAPNLLRYIERTKIASDTQLADTVRTAMITALLEPDVTNPADKNLGRVYHVAVIDLARNIDFHKDGSDTPLGKAFAATLGYPDMATVAGPDGLSKQLRVNNDNLIMIQIRNDKVYTYIESTDGPDYPCIICVPDCTWDTTNSHTHEH